MTDIRSLRPQIRRANRLQRVYTARAAAERTLQDRDATAVDRAKATAALLVTAFDYWRATVKRLPPQEQNTQRLRAAELLVQDAISMETVARARLEEVA